MTTSYELNLLIYAQPQIASGLALARQIAEHSGFGVCVTIVAENTNALKERVQAKSEELGCDFCVRTHDGDSKQLIEWLDSLASSRIVLVPGIDQLSDSQKDLLKRLHVTVVCFESHPGLESPPEGLWQLGTDPDGHVEWLLEHLVQYPEKRVIELEELKQNDGKSLRENSSKRDWIIHGVTANDLEQGIRICRSAVELSVGPVLLVRGEASWWHWLSERELPRLVARFVPQMERKRRRELAEELESGTKSDFEFVALICCSTFLAAFGLLQNSAAVIIGAMLVAPLMTPILGAGLALSQGNRPLFRGSLKAIIIGFVAALTTSFFFGLLVRFVVPNILVFQEGRVILTSEMWARTHPTAIDFLVGLVGGFAAAFARTRVHLADALAGAAIAAALVPPIATAGLHLAFIGQPVAPPENSEWVRNLIYGPIVLFVANMLTIMIGSSWVLWSCGIRADHSRSRRERWVTRTTFALMTLAAAALVWTVQHT